MGARIERRRIHSSHLVAAVSLTVALVVAVPSVATSPVAARVKAAPAETTSGWGQVTGTDGRVYLADDQGRARQLRGINIKTQDLLGSASDARLAATAAAGFDLVRLSIYWDQFEPTQGGFDQTYFDDLATVLDRAEAHGLKVILDMHQDVFGAAFGFNGIPEWATRTDGLPFTPQTVWFLNSTQPTVMRAWQHLYEDADLRQAQIDAWKQVVTQVGEKPAVLGYDLLNEPFGELHAGESLQEAVNRIEGGQLSDMYQRLTDAIRTIDTERWIFVEPANEASLGLKPALRKIDGSRVAYYPHMYDAAIESATYGGSESVLDAKFFDTFKEAIVGYPQRNKVPMLIGEWGVADASKPGMAGFVSKSVSVMDEIASGWSVFYWDPLDTPDPGFDQIVQPWAKAIAGTPASFGWDPATERLRVVFEDSAATGTTDIVLPPAYTSGWKVVTSDAAGTWSSTVDADGIAHVTTADTGGAHTVCVVPDDDTDPCALPDPAGPTTTTSTPTEPAASPATPIEAAADFTG